MVTDHHLIRAKEIIATLGATEHSTTLAYITTVLAAEYWRGFTAGGDRALEIQRQMKEERRRVVT